MLKYIGIMLLSASVSAYGAVLSKQLKDAHALRKEITELARYICNGIRYGSRPVYDVLGECSMPNLKKCGFLPSLLSGCDTRQAVECSLRPLSAFEREKIYSFFTNLGRSSYSENELTYCTQYIAFFEECEKKSEKDVQAKAVLYKKIGILCGILTAIIFI